MAEDTWYSNGNNNWNATNAWNTQADGGGTALSDPDADAHVVIQGSDTITITAAIGNSIKSLTVEAGSNLTGHASHPITISAKGTASFGTNGYAVRIHGGATLGTNVKLIVETQADAWATLNASGSGEVINSLTINHASCNLILQGAATMGSLTITEGELDTHSNNYALTVTGTTEIGPDTGGANQATLTCNTSTVILGSGKTDGAGLHVRQGGTFVGGSGTHTMGSIVVDNNEYSKFTNTSGTCTLNGHSNDNTRTINIGGSSICVAAGTMDVTFGTSSKLQISNFAGVNNLTLTGNVIYRLHGHSGISGDLTITSGTTLDTQTTASSGTFRNLTVTGNITANGTLTCNASAVGAASIMGTGTLNCDTATITCAGGGDIQTANINMDAATISAGSGNSINLFGAGTAASPSGASTITISGSSAASIICRRFGGAWAADGNSTVTLKGPSRTSNLVSGSLYNVVVDGSGETYTLGEAMTINNDVTVTAGTLTGGSVNHSFGSLTIASGGEYIATSGTTTITSRTTGGYSWYSPTTGSTFTHNNGKVKLAYTGNETYWQGTGFYDLEIAGHSAHEHRYNDLTDGSGLTVYNNFTITEGRVRFNQAGDSVTVHGLTKMVSGQYGNTGTAPSGTHNYGNVKIEGGTWKVTSGTCNMSGIRKLGGTLA